MSLRACLTHRTPPFSWWISYPAVVAATALTHAAYISLPFSNVAQPAPIVFLIPVILCAYFGGLGAGLFSTVLAGLDFLYVLSEPVYQFKMAHPVDIVRLIALFLVGVLISVLTGRLHAANAQAARDFAERLSASERLIGTEQRCRLLFENMLEGMAYCRMIFDERRRPVDFVYLEVNAVFEKLTGLADVVGKKVTEVIPGIREAHPDLLERYGRVALSGTPERFEIEIGLLQRWFSISVYSPQKGYFIAVFDEITARKKAENAIRDEEQELAAIYENVPLTMLLLDTSYRIRKINKFREHLAAGLMTELVGELGCEALRCLHALDHPGGCGYGEHCKRCELRAAVLDTIATGLSHQHREARLPIGAPDDSRQITILFTTAPLSVRGQPHVLVTILDITERKKAEDALRTSESRYRTLFEHDPAGDFISTADGKILACNAAFARMFGFASRADAQGSSLASLFSDLRAYELFVEKLQERGTLENQEAELRRCDSAPVYAAANAVAVRADNGELAEVHGYLIDETARRKAEEQLLQAQKMEAVGKLAGGVAHDFNTLLGVILGHCELICEREYAGSPTRKRVDEIQKAARSGAALTQQLLALGRREIAQPVILNLNRVVSEAENMLRRLIPEDIQLVLHLQPDLWRLKADPNQLLQIVLNLATNARDAMPGGGTFQIETLNVGGDDLPRSVPTQEGESDWVVLRVSDTGKGMDKETQARIFEPFFTTKAAGKGNGLGLATVYGIVKQNDGFISVSSEPGQGTAFHIYFPRARDAGEEAQPAASPALVPGGHETVLVIEDSEDLREIVREHLESTGYNVLEAATLADALEAAAHCDGEIHLLLTDVVLRGESGRVIAERLQSLHPQIEVLFMSGYNDDTVIKHSVRLSDVNFIQKPFTRADLVAKVRQALSGSSARANRTAAN